MTKRVDRKWRSGRIAFSAGGHGGPDSPRIGSRTTTLEEGSSVFDVLASPRDSPDLRDQPMFPVVFQ